jgi:hypothetical protein
LIKRALGKQASDYHKSLAKKQDEIEQLNSRIEQLTQVEEEAEERERDFLLF